VSQDDPQRDATGSTVSGAHVASPGIGTTTEPKAAAQAAGPAPSPPALPAGSSQALTERPEVLAGAAFAGAFVAARILKRLFD
jgi:hypothetical protein